ncbi:glycosyltransferase family A protein [Nocardioides gilvus]|uniref:glycosyltransferase family A protein n=1 Tax=Nocardioides gilvus TaxID=1735589 RepID=UPI0013A54F5E|nr:glycosyltransferase family A protein [Nocardioides gilvus]
MSPATSHATVSAGVPPLASVRDLFADLPGPTLVLAAESAVLSFLPPRPEALGVKVVRLWEGELAEVHGREWGSVLLVSTDRSTLRSVASALPDLGHCRDLGVWLTATRSPVVPAPPQNWPPLAAVAARRLPKPGSGAVTVLTFVRPVRVRSVLQTFAHQAVPRDHAARSGLVLAYHGRPVAPGLDLRADVLHELAHAVTDDRVVPPDVVLSAPEDQAGVASDLAPHHVIDRVPVVVTDAGLEPVDEMVFNARGWRGNPPEAIVDLTELVRGGPVTELVVRRARRHRAVRLDLTTADPSDLLKLTMSGIPVLTSGDEPRLAPELAKVLADVPDLDDTLARDGWSVRLRRATFDHHSTAAWRSGLAGRTGVARLAAASASLPPTSVLLASKREHELAGAVARVAAQVGADVELVIATHGFRTDPAPLTEILGRPPVLLDFEDSTFFGDVLTAAAQAASGSVLMKMDDDDWYSPHTVHDLLMARRISGADLVGAAAEFVHLAELDTTVRRTDPSEVFSDWVAGGTMTVSRDLLRELGWFRPVRRWVDAQLLQMVLASGGSVYRTHGLNYVLRRNATGHTWETEAETFLEAGTVLQQWEGFRPPKEGL